MGDSHAAQDQPEQTGRGSPAPGPGPMLTIKGHDVGRHVGQLQQDARQGRVEHIQAVLHVLGILRREQQGVPLSCCYLGHGHSSAGL